MVIGYLYNFSKNSKARFEREQIRLLGTLRSTVAESLGHPVCSSSSLINIPALLSHTLRYKLDLIRNKFHHSSSFGLFTIDKTDNR